MTTTVAQLNHIEAAPQSTKRARPAVWVGRVLSGIAVAFLAVDAGFKFILTPEAMEGTSQLGYPLHVLRSLGFIEAVLVALYVYPRTAVLGAVLWTGYLGGAIATHVRVENPLFSHVLFPIYVAMFIWGGLYLRDARVRGMIARRS